MKGGDQAMSGKKSKKVTIIRSGTFKLHEVMRITPFKNPSKEQLELRRRLMEHKSKEE